MVIRFLTLSMLVVLFYGAGIKLFPPGFDEIRFLREIDLPFLDYVRLVCHDNSNTPVMHSINWCISHIFGAEIWHLRFFSFILMAVSLYYFYSKTRKIWPDNIMGGWAAVCFLLVSYPFIFYSHWAANAYAMYVLADVILLFFTLDVLCRRKKITSKTAIWVFFIAGLPHYSMLITWGGAVILLFLHEAHHQKLSVLKIFQAVSRMRYTLITPALISLQFFIFPPGALIKNDRIDIMQGYNYDNSLVGIIKFIALKINDLYMISASTLHAVEFTFLALGLITIGFFVIWRGAKRKCFDKALFIFLAIQIIVMTVFVLLRWHPLRSKYFPIITIVNALLLERGLGYLLHIIQHRIKSLNQILRYTSVIIISLTFIIGTVKYKKYLVKHHHNQRIIESIKQVSEAELVVDEMALVVFAYHLKRVYSDFHIVHNEHNRIQNVRFSAQNVICNLFLKNYGYAKQMQTVEEWRKINADYKLTSQACFADSTYLVVHFLRNGLITD